ncbi:hypothetical protein ACP1ZQ_004382, partial [Escherichia albertii]
TIMGYHPVNMKINGKRLHGCPDFVIHNRISSIDFVIPHAVLEKELEPQERITFIYETISWEHTLAGTNAMSKWQDRIQ